MLKHQGRKIPEWLKLKFKNVIVRFFAIINSQGGLQWGEAKVSFDAFEI